MMKFWKKFGFRIPLEIAHEVCYAISSYFHFWSISIRTLYQKLWSFEVFSS